MHSTGGPRPTPQGNLDRETVEGFGREWTTFRQGEELSSAERAKIFEGFFGIFPWSELPHDAVGIDVGCGNGRWALLVARRVRRLHALDASPEALETARQNLAGLSNVSFHAAAVDAILLPDASLDFAYSLGVLHHVPDTAGAVRDVARKTGRLPEAWPLAYYRDKSFYVMRTDAFDRFCTRLEQRFTQQEIEAC